MEAANALAEAAFLAEPDKHWAAMLLARAQAARGEIHSALTILDKLCSASPQNWAARRLRVQSLLQAGNARSALNEIGALKTQFPRDGALAAAEAEALKALGEDEAALAALQRAAEFAPNDRIRVAAARAFAARLR